MPNTLVQDVTPTDTYAEVRGKRSAALKALGELFATAPDVSGISPDDAKEIKRVEDLLNKSIGPRFDELHGMEALKERATREAKELQTPGSPMRHKAEGGEPGDGGNPYAGKRLRDVIAADPGYQAFKGQGFKVGGARIVLAGARGPGGVKALFTLSSGNIAAERLPSPVLSAVEERTVGDLIPEGSTDNNMITYLEETTLTNAAAEVAEGGTKPEAALALTERQEPVRKIAVVLPVTKEALDDLPYLEGYLNNRMEFFVKRREETQILVGDGAGSNLRGILNRTGILTQARGTDTNVDAFFKAITKVENTGFAEPTAIVMHPTNWQDVRLLKTADGIYIFGPPSLDEEPRLWGLVVRKTSAMTLGTGLVGAFNPHAELVRREDIEIVMSTEHATNFVENKVTVLAEERLALAVYRPAAFATVTGLTP